MKLIPSLLKRNKIAFLTLVLLLVNIETNQNKHLRSEPNQEAQKKELDTGNQSIFTISSAINLFKNLVEHIFNLPGNPADKEQTIKYINYCLTNFEGRKSTSHESLLRDFYTRAFHARENPDKWNNDLLRETIIKSLYLDRFQTEIGDRSCGDYLDKLLRRESDKAGVLSVLNSEFEGFNYHDISQKEQFITSKFNTHREHLYKGAFTNLNKVSRGEKVS